MNLHEIVNDLIINTKGATEGGLFSKPAVDSSLGVFTPELVICATIVLMLLFRLFNLSSKVSGALTFVTALGGSLVALYCAAPWAHLVGMIDGDVTATAVTRMEIFTGMLVYDQLTVYMRSVLLLFVVLFIIFTKLSGIPDREDSADIYSLVLGSTLGMCLMASANHLLMVFMAIEMASVPSYVLAGLMKGKRVGSEAALKYAVYGAGTAGVMLYGISLIAGLLNTAHLPTLAFQLSDKLPAMPASEQMVLVLGGLMIMAGLAFKLSAVPFHFWAPDVFEGATAEVNAFLSIASKAAALTLLVRLVIGFGVDVSDVKGQFVPGERTAMVASESADALAAKTTAASSQALFNVADEQVEKTAASTTDTASGDSAASDAEERAAALATSRAFMGKLIAFLAIITCTFGNLAAYGQTNIKRLLAYSTIAHAGYMMMAIPAMLAMVGHDSVAAEDAVSALMLYIATYVFMNLGAFAIIAFLRNAMRSEEIADYAGLVRKAPCLVVCFCLILFSLVGLPPLAGFIGKFAIFASLVDGYQVTAAAGVPATYLMVLLVVAGLNTAISLFYYLRVVKVMTMDAPADTQTPFEYSEVSLSSAYVWLITLPTALLIVNWNGLNQMCQAAASYLLP